MFVAFYLSSNPVHDRVIKALYEGCPEDKKLVEGFQYTPADIGVVFGVYKSKVAVSYPRGVVYRKHRSDGADMIVLETGYIKRGDGPDNYYAAGFNGLNGRADFKNKSSPIDRLLQLGVELKPWRHDGKHIVVCGQVPWDASVDHLDYHAWKDETLGRLRALTDREVKFKQHPCIEPGPPLDEFLKDAWACVTLNSNSAVEAVLEGIPAFVGDLGSMAWSVGNYDIGRIENPTLPYRQQWLQDLAYTQWTPAEMSEGKTWSHLLRQI